MLKRLRQTVASVASKWGVPLRPSYLSVVEVQDAAPLAGALFLRVFKHPVPDFPRHFVLVSQPPGEAARALCYVHHTAFETGYLAGGLVSDGNEFRRLSKEAQKEVMKKGGMAQWLMSESCRRLQACDAVYAYIGDDKSRDVNLRVGYRLVHAPYLYVFPSTAVSKETLALLTEKVVGLGPF